MKEVDGRTVKKTIGRFGAWTVEEARKRARELLVKLDRGEARNAREPSR